MTPEIWAVTGSLGAAFLLGMWAFINRKGTEKFQGTAPLPATYQQMWDRMGILERDVESLKSSLRASRSIIYDLADQWPSDYPKPVLNQDDVDVAGDTLPHRFRHTPK